MFEASFVIGSALGGALWGSLIVWALGKASGGDAPLGGRYLAALVVLGLFATFGHYGDPKMGYMLALQMVGVSVGLLFSYGIARLLERRKPDDSDTETFD